MSDAAYLITESSILVYYNGKTYTVANDHPNYNKVKEALKAGNYSIVPDLCDVRCAVNRWLSRDRDFSLVGDRIVFGVYTFTNAVTDKVLRMIDAGHNAEPLFNFLRKVRANPSNTAQEELLLFCVANGFMIHEDGDIIAYKGVRNDYKDIHSGTIDNSVGKVITMERPSVDDRRDVTCSHGLHFASHQYASTWAGSSIGHLMVMKINPRDVVSIPNDYNNQKGRCCRYEVIAEAEKFQPLAPREVYRDRDLGIGGPWDDEECAESFDFDEHPYDAGYDAGYCAVRYDDTSDFIGSDAAAYRSGYAAGWGDAN